MIHVHDNFFVSNLIFWSVLELLIFAQNFGVKRLDKNDNESGKVKDGCLSLREKEFLSQLDAVDVAEQLTDEISFTKEDYVFPVEHSDEEENLSILNSVEKVLSFDGFIDSPELEIPLNSKGNRSKGI